MTEQEREQRQERNRREWKRSVKRIVPQIICCGDPDMFIATETRHAVKIMCGECHGHTVITQPGH